MSEPKLYDNERDILDMDRAGNYYFRHVSAMTGEALYSKSDIAAELGWRDMQIDQLKAENEILIAKNGAFAGANDSLQNTISHLVDENERLREGMRGDYDLDAWLDWCKERDTLRKQVDEARELLGEAAVYVPDRLDEKIDAWLEAHRND